MKTFKQNLTDIKRFRKALAKDMEATNKELEAFNSFIADFGMEVAQMNFVVSELMEEEKLVPYIHKKKRKKK